MSQVMSQAEHYNKRLTGNAKKLRYSMTKAEACLWKYILGAMKTGYVFRRQRPIGNYIVDFCCLSQKLIIEVDGASHAHNLQWVKDRKRQSDLEQLGYKVIRFTNDEVLTNINGVKFMIENELEESKP